jgi:hypothetical protein
MKPSYPVIVENFLNPDVAKHLNDYMINFAVEDDQIFNSNRKFGMASFSLNGPFVFGDGGDEHKECEETMKDCVNKVHNLMASYYKFDLNYFKFEHSTYSVMLPGSYLNHHVDQDWDHSGHPQGQEYPDVYSAMLYLNEEYTGGELVFPDIEMQIKPNPGDLIYFKGDNTIVHGVDPVLSGQRCNMILFFQVHKNKGDS